MQCTTLRLIAAIALIADLLDNDQQVTAIQFEDGSGTKFNFQVNGGPWQFTSMERIS